MPQPKEVKGVDTLIVGEEGEGWRWSWRGKGLLKIASSEYLLLSHSLSHYFMAIRSFISVVSKADVP